MLKFMKKLFLGLLLLPFLIVPSNAQAVRPVVSPTVYAPVWDVTSYGGAGDQELVLNLTNTADAVTFQEKYAPSDPYECASVFNVFDFEGLLKKDIPINSMAGYGARNVTNLCLWSQDLTAAGWSAQGSPTNVTETSYQCNASNDYLRRYTSLGTGLMVGRKFVCRVTISSSSPVVVKPYSWGSGTIIYLFDITKCWTITPTEQIITISGVAAGETGYANNQILFGIVPDDAGASYPLTINITDFQLEEVTGQTNQNPSDHIPTTTAAVTEYYDTENGNTVTSNVVTEAAGTDLTSNPGWAVWPSTTNVIGSTVYRDLTHADWVKTNGSITAEAVVLIDGTTVADKNTFTASAANGTAILVPYVSASGVHAGGIFIKRKTGTGAIEVTIDGGTTWVAVTTQVAGDSGWHLCETTLPTVTDPEFGIRLVTSGDAVYLDFAQMDDGFARVSSHPIAGGVTLAGQALIAADAANASKLIEDKQGYVYVEAQLLPDDLSLKNARILYDGTSLLFAGALVNRFLSNDGTNNLQLFNSLVGYSKGASYWWDSSKQISANGSSTSIGSYDGAWGSGALYIGSRYSGADQFNGIISKIIFGKGIKTTQADMETLTTP
ncbi:MAG: hypothetical protein KAI40_03450 [Desulfobacterales bacterium]|nr:hypothetical protein [Desulfobacterales bacterium]